LEAAQYLGRITLTRGAKMGAWGFDVFENDTACDYNLSGIEGKFDHILKVGEAYLEAPDAEEALAADILARLEGRFGQQNAYTDGIDRWIKSIKVKPSKELVEKARQSIVRILTEPCELLELWRDSEDFDSWKSCVPELSNRV
jgi:hypothetical protein